MEDISLVNGIVISISIDQFKEQDYIEVKLESGQVVIITATVNGRLRIGLKMD